MSKLTRSDIAAIQALIGATLQEGNLTQHGLSIKAKVNQSTVSRAANGQIKRKSHALIKLCNYAELVTGQSTYIPEALESAVRTYLSAGGEVDAACMVMSALTKIQTKR